MIFELLTLAALTLVDPTGDAHGAGDLNPPTASIYASVAPFDLVEVSVLDEPRLAVEIRLAGISNPLNLPLGLSLPVIDVYLDTKDGGESALLPGPGLRMPDRVGWDVALRVHGDAAFLVESLDPAAPVFPLSVERLGNRIVLRSTRWAPDEVRRIDAMTGVYDAFGADAWRAVALSSSPWAFSSDSGAFPVVDVLASSGAVQRGVLERGVLPSGRFTFGVAGWLTVATLGIGVALVGLWLRSRAPGAGIAPEAGQEDLMGEDWLIDQNELTQPQRNVEPQRLLTTHESLLSTSDIDTIHESSSVESSEDDGLWDAWDEAPDAPRSPEDASTDFLEEDAEDAWTWEPGARQDVTQAQVGPAPGESETRDVPRAAGETPGDAPKHGEGLEGASDEPPPTTYHVRKRPDATSTERDAREGALGDSDDPSSRSDS